MLNVMVYKVDTINLFPAKYGNIYCIKFSSDNYFIQTNKGNIICYEKEIIENIIYSLQKNDLIKINSKNQIERTSQDSFYSLYNLFCLDTDNEINYESQEAYSLIGELIDKNIISDPLLDKNL